MRSIKNPRLIVSFSIAVLLASISLAVAWTSVANNAFASDEKANDTVNVSVNYKGVDSGTSPEVTAVENSQPFYYAFGEEVSIESGSTYTAEIHNGWVTINIYSGDVIYTFSIVEPIGYDSAEVTPGTSGKIDTNTEFMIEYEKYTGTYQINFSIIDEHSQPMPNYSVSYYDKNWNLIEAGLTDNNGFYRFVNIAPEIADGYVVGEAEGYMDTLSKMSPQLYNKDTNPRTRDVSASLTSIDKAQLVLSSKDNKHAKFYFEFKAYSVSDPRVIHAQGNFMKKSLAINMDGIQGDWVVDAKGNLVLDYVSGSMHLYMKITPIANDNSIVDYWSIDTHDGDVKILNSGDNFSVDSKGFVGEVFYADTPQPEPTPDPTPTPAEDVNATPQTGDDTNAFILLAILAATCATVLIARRKINQS